MSSEDLNGERQGQIGSSDIRSRLVVKAVRNVRRGYEKDEAGRGMYRPGLKLDLQRSRLLTESYKQTDGEPMVMRRAKAFRHILANMDIYIQDWERIVGNHASTPRPRPVFRHRHELAKRRKGRARCGGTGPLGR